MQWYLTKYARLADGKVELLTYTPMSFAEAQYKTTQKLPNNEFYFAECKVGSLLAPQSKPIWVARERYSHKPYVAKTQADAEVKAQELLNQLSHSNINIDIKSIFSDMQLLKPLLTKPQYTILLDYLMAQPQVIKILYERRSLL